MKIANGVNSPVEQIKSRLSIEDIVSSYLKLERAGANFRARCPFHNEKTPSFFVSPDRGSYYCFGCGAKGDIFSFVEEFEGLDFKGALKVLADKAGVRLGEWNPEKESEKEKLYRVMESATRFFEKEIENNSEILQYLSQRGLDDKSVKSFRIGFVRDGWQGLMNHLSSLGFSFGEMEKAGLIKKSEKDFSGKNKFYDRFRGRIMFPISDSSGRIIAFSGRIWKDDGKSAKYLNSPDTPIFNKSSVLYGLDKAKDSIRKSNFSILVEGQMDLVLSHQAGFRNTVASSGTALSDSTTSRENVVSNLGLLRRLSGNIVLAFDADKAGFNACMRAGKIALALGMEVKVANLPEGVDPADLISKHSVEMWKKVIRESKHIIEFLLDKVLEKNKDDTRKSGKEIKEKVLPFVVSLDSAIEKANFIKKISNASGIPEDAIKEDIKKVEKETKNEHAEFKEVSREEVSIFRKDKIERKLVGIILWQNGQKDKSIDQDKVLERLAILLNLDKNEILDKWKELKEDLVFEAEVFYGEGALLNKDVEELIVNLEMECLKEELARNMYSLSKTELEKDKDLINKNLEQINIINKKIQEIKNSRFK